MDKREVVEKVRKYSDLIRTHFPVRLVILYGSYVKATVREDSDIDVAVVVNKIDGDFLMSEVKLYKLRREVDERIEPILLEADNDRSGFLEQILKNGEVVYSNQRQ
ncbi:nucleotidyltransferase domain-containing protein [candidate division NPL-UPA2 bacterium]|nr:nucleotidyltransferase domain-containing protein [candidate division NPL-UPA2 bacterium]